MNEETLKALKDSIAAWEGKAAEDEPHRINTGVGGCPLCIRFYRGGCVGCPVREKTRLSGCNGSPYFRAAVALGKWVRKPEDRKRKSLWREAAQVEVEFLRSLLPEEGA